MTDQPGLFDMLYGGLPPHQKGSDTSKLAAIELDGTRRATLRAMVFRALRERGSTGATDEELQQALRLQGNTERPRRRELEEVGLVRDSGVRRKTQAGKAAVVWVAAA